MNLPPERHWQDALQNLARGRTASAKAHLEALQVSWPHDARTDLLASRIAWQEDRVRDATRYARAAAAQVMTDPAVLCAVVEALLGVGEVVVARECLAHPALVGSEETRWLLQLARYRQSLDEHAEALRLVECAIAKGAEGPDVRFRHGVLLYFNGRLSEAEAELVACLRGEPGRGRVALALSRLRRQTHEDNHLDLIATGLVKAAHGTWDHAALLFAQYKEFEDLGRHDDAWQALKRGNAVMHARTAYDAAASQAYLDRLADACSHDLVAPRVQASEGPQPIFILGMARSGTTVLERMLGNHSQVISAGELVDFGMQLHWAADTVNTHSNKFVSRIPDLDLADVGRRYLAQTQWRAKGRRFYIDKQPPNWALAGLIHAALPGARILHMVRDPMDVCFSNWRAFFGKTYAYSYELGDLASYYLAYRRTMAHWHKVMPGAIMDVHYADLVQNPEATLHKVFAFCGLDWESGCDNIARNAAPSATLSAAQVRGTVRRDTSSRWMRYVPQLSRLEQLLAESKKHGLEK